MALSNTNFDGTLATTAPGWIADTFEDMISSNNPFFAMLLEDGEGQVDELGQKAVHPFMFPSTTGPQTAGVVSGYDAVTKANTGGLTAAEYAWAEYYNVLAIEQLDIDKNSGKAQKVNLVKGVLKKGLLDFHEKLNADLWAYPENTNSAGARSQLCSIQTLINGGTSATTAGSATPLPRTLQTLARAVVVATGTSAVTTVGGVPRAAAGAAYWCPNVINTADSFSVNVLSAGNTAASRRKDKPNLIVVTNAVYDRIATLASVGGSSGGRIYSDSKLANLGFNAFRFGDADIITDDMIPEACFASGTATAKGHNIFWINMKYLSLQYKSLKPEVTPLTDDRPIKSWGVRWVGQVTSGNLGRVHTRHVNVTP